MFGWGCSALAVVRAQPGGGVVLGETQLARDVLTLLGSGLVDTGDGLLDVDDRTGRGLRGVGAGASGAEQATVVERLREERVVERVVLGDGLVRDLAGVQLGADGLHEQVAQQQDRDADGGERGLPADEDAEQDGRPGSPEEDRDERDDRLDDGPAVLLELVEGVHGTVPSELREVALTNVRPHFQG